jgi:O-antigen/teichoic acid export membrane protein
LGEEFLKSEILIKILAVNIIPVGIYTIVGNQLLVPIGKHSEYAKSIILGIIVNVILNFFMINKWGSVGACYASLISNLAIAMYQMYHTRDYFFILKNIWNGRKSIIASVIMYIILLHGVRLLTSSMCNTIILVMISVIVYVCIMVLLRDKMMLWIWDTVKTIIHHNDGN